MKRMIPFLLALMLVPVGCKTSSTIPAQSIAPGYLNAQDQTMGKTLAAVNGFINRMKADIAAGTYTPSPREVTALNALIATTDAANQAYLSYHGGTTTQTAAQTAITVAYTQQQTLASNGGK